MSRLFGPGGGGSRRGYWCHDVTNLVAASGWGLSGVSTPVKVERTGHWATSILNIAHGWGPKDDTNTLHAQEAAVVAFYKSHNIDLRSWISDGFYDDGAGGRCARAKVWPGVVFRRDLRHQVVAHKKWAVSASGGAKWSLFAAGLVQQGAYYGQHVFHLAVEAALCRAASEGNAKFADTFCGNAVQWNKQKKNMWQGEWNCHWESGVAPGLNSASAGQARESNWRALKVACPPNLAHMEQCDSAASVEK